MFGSQLAKAAPSITVSVDGKITSTKFLQLEKAVDPILVRPFGSVTFVKPLQLTNAPKSIVLKDSGNCIVCMEAQPKQLSSSSSTESGTIILRLFIFLQKELVVIL